MFKKLLLAIFVGAALLLQGCSAPPINFSVDNVQPARQKFDAELKNVNVMWGRPNELVGDVPSDWKVDTTQSWAVALTDAIDRAVLFQDDSSKKVTLSVRILELSQPFILSTTAYTNATARYEVIDRSSGKVLWTEVIKTQGQVPATLFSYAPTRVVESINRAVQLNIKEFLSKFR